MLSAVAAAAVLSFTGCSSVSVTGKRQTAGAQKPAVIYVENYDTGSGEWNVTSRSKTSAQFRRDTADGLSQALVTSISRYLGTPAQRTSGRSVPPGSWLVTGRFIRVNEGNPAARMILGLGAGGSKMETETLVYDGSAPRSPFLRFGTTGGSNAMPGMIISSGPVGAVANLAQQSSRGVRDDTKRTARMVTASLGEYMSDRGWIDSAGLKTKKPGQFQLLQAPPPAATRSRR